MDHDHPPTHPQIHMPAPDHLIEVDGVQIQQHVTVPAAKLREFAEANWRALGCSLIPTPSGPVDALGNQTMQAVELWHLVRDVVLVPRSDGKVLFVPVQPARVRVTIPASALTASNGAEPQ